MSVLLTRKIDRSSCAADRFVAHLLHPALVSYPRPEVLLFLQYLHEPGFLLRVGWCINVMICVWIWCLLQIEAIAHILSYSQHS